VPITSSMVVAGKGNRSTKSFDPFASPMFEGGADATRSIVSAEVPSVGVIDNQVGNDAPGTVPTEQTHTASGSDAGAADSGNPDTAEIVIAVPDGQSFAGTNILGGEDH
jgi:hypothetical protein